MGNLHLRNNLCLYFILLYLFYAAQPDTNHAFPPQTRYVLCGETIELDCDIRPGRATSLYAIWWTRSMPTSLTLIPDSLSPPHRSISPSNFSLSLSIEDMSQNGSVYHCSVQIRSCFPHTHSGCSGSSSYADGARITLIVGGE